MLQRLVLRPHWIILVRYGHLFDMRSKHMGYDLPARKFHQPPGATSELSEIAHVQSSRIQAVAGEQHAGLAIVKRQTECVMPWNRNHIQDTLAQIPVSDSLCPFVHLQKLALPIP